MDAVDLICKVGSISISNPVICASGTVGFGDEISSYGRLDTLGAIVVKSLSSFSWPGNKPIRVVPIRGGMLNSVGLEGPGTKSWIERYLPNLRKTNAKIIVSVWGRTVQEFVDAIRDLDEVSGHICAIELNLSCPNHNQSGLMFSQSGDVTYEIASRTKQVSRVPLWAKLTPATPDIVTIASQALSGGVEAITLVNTMPGMKIDTTTRRPALGGTTGGVSGPCLHPIAVKNVYECRRALPDAPIIGVGGVMSGLDAIELIMAGANAVQVGTASFIDPRAPWRILAEIEKFCKEAGVASVSELISCAH